MVSLNIGLGIFNLIPFPPLDGSKVVAMFLPDRCTTGGCSWSGTAWLS